MQLTRSNGSLLLNQSVAMNKWGKLNTYLFPVGTTTVNYILTDAAGNQTECSFTVTVQDTQLPVVNCPDNLTVQLPAGACEATPALVPVFVNDNCGAVTITYSPAAPYPIGTTAVTMTVVDEAGNSTSCVFNITVLEHIPAVPELACNGQINVSLGPDCTVEITPQMMLAGTDYRCYDNYVVTLYLDHGLPPLDSSPFATLELAGLELVVTVCDPQTGECCWGTVLVEQKEDPEFICPADTVLYCIGGIEPQQTGEPVITSCIIGDPIISYVDDVQENEFCDDFPLILDRTWTVSDAFGNTSTCTQNIKVRAFELADIVFPRSYDNFDLPSFNCSDVAANPHLTHPDSTGYPTLLDGSNPFAGANYCGASFLYTDEVFSICGGSYQILRTWKVLNPCQPVEPGVNPLVHIQSIQVLDVDGPALTCPANMVISSGPFTCRGTAILPVPQFTDGCSVASYTVSIGSGSLVFVNGLYILSNLEEGIHAVTFRAQDACGRKSQCTFYITVEDQIEPIAICDEDLRISVGGQGFARVSANDVNEGSNDNCGIERMEVRRLVTRDSSCTVLPDAYFTEWAEFIDFNCCDVGDNVRIELRVTDYFGNSNVCWLEVLIEDKIRPFCTAPHAATLDCDDVPYDFNLGDTLQLQTLFGNAEGADNCFGVTTRELPSISNMHDCGFGTLIRRFQAVDAQGNISTNVCEQLITINEVHNYEIKFPKDASANCGVPNPDTLMYYTPGCDLMAVTVTDEVFEASGDECYKIFRKYRLLNWCEYDGTSPAIVVGRDEDCDGVPGDEAVWVLVRPNGQTYYDRDSLELNANPAASVKGISCDGITNPAGHWLNSTIDVNATKDPITGSQNSPTNPNNGPNDNIRNIASVGLWEYTQIIKVYDLVDPVVSVEAQQPFCSTNNTTCNGEVEIPFQITEICTPDDLTITVFADEFADGIMLVDVTAQALSGMYPNYTIKGTFPLGAHRFTVVVADGCGNDTSREIPFSVVDCKAPSPVCINGLSIELMPTEPNTDADGDGDTDSGAMTIWADDFLASPITDCTGPIRYSIHKASAVIAGTDIPNPNHTSLVLTCDDLGTVILRIYAWDSALNPYAVQPDGTVGGANYDWCETYVIVQDNALGLCGVGGQIAGLIATEEDEPVARVAVNLSGLMSDNTVTPVSGTYLFTNLTTGPQADYTISPELDTLPANGITTFDLILISRHILNVDLLDSPYKMIAADLNNDKKITTVDLIFLRRLILLIDTELASNTSWRFVRADYVFPVPANPWFEVFPEVYNVNDLTANITNADFVAVKIGDVNSSATTSFTSLEERNTEGIFAFEVKDEKLLKGNEYTIEVKAPKSAGIVGYQGTFSLDPAALELLGIDYGLAKEAHFGMRYADRGFITTSWNSADADAVAEGVMFTLRVRAKMDALLSSVLSIGSQYTPAEAYHQSGDLHDVAIHFSSGVLSGGKVILEQNTPNPFAERTTIGFSLPQAYEEVTLTISDSQGRALKVFRNAYSAGRHEISIDAKELSQGVLFYTLEAGKFRTTRSMIIQE